MDKKIWIVFCVLAVTLAGFLILVWEPVPIGDQPDASTPEQRLQLQFTELCTKNDTVLCDNYGRYPDYVELYNAGAPVDLSGCYFTIGGENSLTLEGIVLQTGQYRCFFFSEEYTGFALGASGGDCLQLIGPDGTVLAQTNTTALTADQVMLWDGKHYITSFEASPGFSNDGAGAAAFREGVKLDVPSVTISEVLVQNEAVFPDGEYLYPDVVELHNTTGADVSLEGWCLSDSLSNRYTYRLDKVIIPAEGYLLLCCDGSFYTEEGGLIHTNFGLSYGETLVLTDTNGGYTSVKITYPGENTSLSLVEGEYTACAPSLGYANDREGEYAFAEGRMDRQASLIVSEVLLSGSDVPYEGQFLDVVEITNRSAAAVSTKSWYLSDDGDPFTYPLPEATLAPGQTLVIVCTPEATGFGLSEGESLRLTAPDHRHLPEVVCVSEKGKSLSLWDYENISYDFADTTLGYANTEKNASAYRAQLGTELRINEVISANASYLKGYYGKTCDWLELYNASEDPVDLSTYHITNNPGNLEKFPLPAKTLQPGEYLVIFLSKDTTNLQKSYDMLPFTISSDGEELLLSKDGMVMDYITVPALDVDVSYGRPESSTDCDLLASVTPGSVNSGPADICAAPVALTAQGSYDGVEYLDILLEGDGDIYYTTDCTVPDHRSSRYTGPIRITQTTVIRAVCMENGRKASSVVDLTYLINENDQLEAVCIVAEPSDLFSYETGIWAEGEGASEVFPYRGANFWMDWERKASVTLFETDGSIAFSEPCGISIFGNASRGYDKKSLSCFFRSRYGENTLNYALFGDDGADTFESFVLRSGGQDVFTSRIRDELITSLAGEQLSVAVQRYRPVVLYINGKYYGVYFIREKLNEHYLAANYQLDPSNSYVLEWNAYENEEYQDLYWYVRSHDLWKEENYSYVAQQVDLQSYIDYTLAQIWVGNVDNSNVKFFRNSEGKWYWIFYDLDRAFIDIYYDAVEDHLDPQGTGTQRFLSTDLINGLLKNQTFFDDFMERMAWQCNHVWTEENINARIDDIVSAIEADMGKDCRRWGVDYEQWQRNIEQLRSFARKRTSHVIMEIADYFHLSEEQMREYGF